MSHDLTTSEIVLVPVVGNKDSNIVISTGSFINGQVIQGDKLYVNQSSSYLSATLKFLQECTQSFDSSHDVNHGISVFFLTIQILDQLYPVGTAHKYNVDKATLASLLHDTRDHKYPDCVSQDVIDTFLDNCVGETDRRAIVTMIENVSWSKRARGRKTPEDASSVFLSNIVSSVDDLSAEDKVILTAIQDADQITAIGKVGILRCEDFAYARHLDQKKASGSLSPPGVKSWGHIPVIVSNVRKYADEKLLRLYPEKWITTVPGRLIAEPLHAEMVEFMKTYQGSIKLQRSIE